MKLLVNLPMPNGVPVLPDNTLTFHGNVLHKRLPGKRGVYIFSGTPAEIAAIRAAVPLKSCILRWNNSPVVRRNRLISILGAGQVADIDDAPTMRGLLPDSDIDDVDDDSQLEAEAEQLQEEP